MGGRPRKPTALKILHGDFDKNPQRRNRQEPVPEVALPKASTKLGPCGRAEFKRICRELELLRVISEADRASIEMYAKAYELMHECDKIAKREGRFYQTDSGPKEHPAAKAFRSYADQCIKMLSSFGLTPTSRTRLAVNDKKKENTDEQYFFGDTGT